MQEFANSPSLRNGIFDLLSTVKLATDANVKLLDYTIQLFRDNGLFSDYYGYHNVNHELEVTYVTLLSGIHALHDDYISRNDLNYLYASALLHDFDPDKSGECTERGCTTLFSGRCDADSVCSASCPQPCLPRK